MPSTKDVQISAAAQVSTNVSKTRSNELHTEIAVFSDRCKGKGESHVRVRTLGECPLEGHLS